MAGNYVTRRQAMRLLLPPSERWQAANFIYKNDKNYTIKALNNPRLRRDMRQLECDLSRRKCCLFKRFRVVFSCYRVCFKRWHWQNVTLGLIKLCKACIRMCPLPRQARWRTHYMYTYWDAHDYIWFYLAVICNLLYFVLCVCLFYF